MGPKSAHTKYDPGSEDAHPQMALVTGLLNGKTHDAATHPVTQTSQILSVPSLLCSWGVEFLLIKFLVAILITTYASGHDKKNKTLFVICNRLRYLKYLASCTISKKIK